MIVDSEKAIIRLLDKWDLTPEQRAAFFSQASNFRQDRIGQLLLIHYYLRSLYPQNEELIYGWVNMREIDFDNKTPINLILEDGNEGVRRVLQHLKNLTQK